MVSFSSVALLALAYASCLVNARPLVGRNDLDVAAPPVTYPTKGVVWTAGGTQTITWDISKLPAQITNPIGQVVLGWLDSTDGLNLQLSTPLAQGFSITAGSVDIVVPSQYPDGDNYIIALIGSADNISPEFTITGGSPSSGTVDPNPSSISTPASQPNSPPTSTPGSGPPTVQDVPSPNTSPAVPPSSVSSSSSSSGPTPSPSSVGNQGGSSASDNSSAWGNKPAGTMVVSLLAASLVTLFL